ncbi:SDR family oxidoreductase [Salimicrobium sp. PL1-032A]|uniref:SDR family oxidoreductase n=1 Tax=Salimicrobium sp. PL1-032A TaxID=3095364 RepID=UPI003260B30C
MSILVTGFTGKVGSAVAESLKEHGMSFTCAVRNVEKAKREYGDSYSFVNLDLTDPSTFEQALVGIDKVFLMYPPGGEIQFDAFLEAIRTNGISHIVYLSVKDVQFLPFIHHYKNEKAIRKLGVPYTFIRAGYFMQNLEDVLSEEIRQRQRIFIPAGKGKTSFADTRNLAEVALRSFQNPSAHLNKHHVITGDKAVDFYRVAEIMTMALGKRIDYTNPSVKEFKSFMVGKGADESFVNVVIGIHFPTKLGLAKGVTKEFETITGRKPISIERYIEDNRNEWL